MGRIKLFDRQEVLEKAMILFWKMGYHATSIQMLVEGLKISRASLYDTFGGKEELFYTAFLRYREIKYWEMVDCFKNAPSVKLGFTTLFEGTIESLTTDSQKKGCLVVNAITELIPGSERTQHMLIETRKAIEDAFCNYLKTGVEKHETLGNKDLKVIATLLYSLYSGLTVMAKTNKDKAHLMSIVKEGLTVLD